ncbi:ABC transporter substrate-binding protein [Bradyrhizobium sp. 190]|uniref:ABC transporter substrate-binding protein n=1 Tax=Bradyrhizobium sp. 190 TaxID=2782658 RepID=UPI0035ABDAB9
MMRTIAMCCAGLLALAGSTARAENGVTANEILIGQTMPYSGPLSGYSGLGKVAQAYFEKVNAEGGISGRKLKLHSLDDAYSPPKTVEQTRRLVEQDEVLLVFGSLGTPTNSAVHRYLNAKKVPHLFITTGASKWADPKHFPWTMGGMASYHSEGVIYAKHVLRTKPDAKIAILSQNDDFGRDYVSAFKRGLGDKAASMIVAEAVYETTQPTIDSQLATLKASGANVFFGVAIGKFGSQMIRRSAEMGFKPDLFLVPTSVTSIATILQPAGLENATGLVSAAYLKNINDPQWADDADVKEYFGFMKRYMPAADPHDTTYASGYTSLVLLAQVLRACGDDLSRANVLKKATSLNKVSLPLLLPGITVTTGSDDYLLFQQLRMQRFDGKSWVGFGELIEDQEP